MDKKRLRNQYRQIFKNLSLPEWLAMFRILTFPAVLLLTFLLDRKVFGITYLILFSTDILDGFAAWLFKNDTDRREILDTWGDNFYFLAGIGGFYRFETTFFMNNLEIILMVLFFYLLELIFCIVKFGIPSNFHNYMAKLSAFSIVFFVSFTFFFGISTFLFRITLICCILDLLDEFIILFSLKSWRTHINGFWEVL